LLNEDYFNWQKAVGLLVLVAILWSLGGLLLKYVKWHPLAISGGRSAIAAVVALIFLRRPQFAWSYTQIGGAVAYAAMVILFVLANKLTTAANAILLQYSAPIYVAIFGPWFLGEKSSRRDWISLLAVVGGIALFFFDKLTTWSVWGNLCALGSGVGYAWFALFLRKQKDKTSLESVILGNLIAALVGLLFMLQTMPSASSLGVLVLLGIVQLGLPYVLYTFASKHVTALDLILITAIEPVLNPIWVLLFAGEVPGQWAICGGLVVLLAVTIRSILSRDIF